MAFKRFNVAFMFCLALFGSSFTNTFGTAVSFGQQQEAHRAQLRNHQAQLNQYLNKIAEFQANALKFIAAGAATVHAPAPQPFSCQGKTFGYYADVLSNCQEFHICQPQTAEAAAAGLPEPVLQTTLRCPNQTLFNQQTLTCTRTEDFNINCADQVRFYSINNQFGAVTSSVGSEISETSSNSASSVSSSSSVNSEANNVAFVAPVDQPVVYSNTEEVAVPSYESASVESSSSAAHSDNYEEHYNENHAPASVENPTESKIEAFSYPGQPTNIFPGAVSASANTASNTAFVRSNQPASNTYSVSSSYSTSYSSSPSRAQAPAAVAAAPVALPSITSHSVSVPYVASSVEETSAVENVNNFNVAETSYSSEEVPSASAQPAVYQPKPETNIYWAAQPISQPQPETNVFWASHPSVRAKPETNIYWATQPSGSNAVAAASPSVPVAESAPIAPSAPIASAPVSTFTAPAAPAQAQVAVQAAPQTPRVLPESPILRARRLRQ